MSKPYLGTYSPQEVSLILGGYTIVGFGDSKISISKADDLVMPKEGVDGEVSIAVSAKKLGTLSFTIQNTSPSNGILETWAFQAATGKGFAPFPVLMEDPAGSSLVSTVGWIQSQPDYELADEVGERTWVIGLANAMTQPSVEQAGALEAMEAFQVL